MIASTVMTQTSIKSQSSSIKLSSAVAYELGSISDYSDKEIGRYATLYTIVRFTSSSETGYKLSVKVNWYDYKNRCVFNLGLKHTCKGLSLH